MKPRIACFAVATLIALAGTAHAQTFFTPGGSVDTDLETVYAEAVFTAGNGTLTIDLSNLLTVGQVDSIGQNVTGLFFTLSNSSSTGSIGSSTSTFITVAGDGSVSSYSVSGTDKMGWGLSFGSGKFCLDGLGGGQPKNTVLGGTEGSFASYTNANSSISGNGPHNPFAQGEADWSLTISGVTASTVVTSATFQFGTTAGDNIAGHPTPAPEPFTLAFAGFGALLGMAKVRRASRSNA